jgi:tRNA modification GTPase
LAVGLVDTAGIRKSDDVIEREGVVRARQAADVADLTIVVLDRSRGLTDDDRAVVEAAMGGPHVVVANKADLPEAWMPESSWHAVAVSAKTGDGLPQLIDLLSSRLGAAPERRDQPLVTNVRHAALLDRARVAIERARAGLSGASSTPEEFVLADLQDASAHLQEITGRRTTDDLLRHIFERFCIGK